MRQISNPLFRRDLALAMKEVTQKRMQRQVRCNRPIERITTGTDPDGRVIPVIVWGKR